MSGNSKTIKINTDYFSNIGSKTRKNREKQSKPLMQKPIINPNSLKRHLLNRIKEHKTREKMEIDESQKKQKNQEIQNQKGSGSDSNNSDFSDEFYDSINYLSSLSKKHKEDGDKKKYEREIEKRHQQVVANKTLKNYGGSAYAAQLLPYVELELPDELKEPIIQVSTPTLINSGSNYKEPDIRLNYTVTDNVPYGCLKGGLKPTYRSLNNTRRNYVEPVYQAPIVEKYSVNAPVNDRSKRLEILKQKIKKHEEMNMREPQQRMSIMQPMIQDSGMGQQQVQQIEKSVSITLQEPIKAPEEEEPTKKFIKRTIKRKYTLGKSKIYKKVGVLIKDRNTRKNVLTAHKELKKKPINDIKNYLKKHGLLKVGSNAPNDVLRKTYESAMLAGDIINTNKDTLLHNFLNDNENE
jgi:hypothetical protein